MSKYVEGFDVNQLTFFPMSFDAMIDEDNPVRGISAIVDTISISATEVCFSLPFGVKSAIITVSFLI